MKLLIFISSFLISSVVYSANEVDWLKGHNPNEYFPRNAEYIKYPELCNERTCFNIVAVSYVTTTNKGMRRVAVFSNAGEYLGVYSGFQEMPLKVIGSELIFHESEFGNTINFSGKQPPITAHIDGENFAFESKP